VFDCYADFLRALGHELDERRAEGIVVEELDDGVFVSYQRQDSSIALHYRKVSAMVSLDEWKGMLQEAYIKRQPLPAKWGLWGG
jgi:hypothetical protein